MNDEIQGIISGNVAVKYGESIYTVASNLKRSEGTSSLAKTDKRFKIEETEKLKLIVDVENLWVKDIDFNNYISEGAEQKVYLKDNRFVIKLNDGIYYLSWIDYLNNLLLHNHYFPGTAYTLLRLYQSRIRNNY